MHLSVATDKYTQITVYNELSALRRAAQQGRTKVYKWTRAISRNEMRPVAKSHNLSKSSKKGGKESWFFFTSRQLPVFPVTGNVQIPGST